MRFTELLNYQTYTSISRYAMTHDKELLYTILCHTTSKSTQFNEKIVISTANIFISIASKMNKNCNAFQKLMSVVLQSCGLTDVGLSVLSKFGTTLTPRSLLDVRTDLAIKDEEHTMSVAKNHHIAVVLDNLDIEHNKILNHKTLPILLCRKVDEEIELLDDQRSTLDETLLKFNEDFFHLDSSENCSEKEAFLEVQL